MPYPNRKAPKSAAPKKRATPKRAAPTNPAQRGYSLGRRGAGFGGPRGPVPAVPAAPRRAPRRVARGLPAGPAAPRQVARGLAPVNGEIFGAANGVSPGAGARAARIAAAQRVAELGRRNRLLGRGTRFAG